MSGSPFTNWRTTTADCGTNVHFVLWRLSVITVAFPQKVKPAMASVADLIAEAIQKKLIVRAIYQSYERIMCPHVIGYKKGVLNALFFQFGGGSKSGLPVGGMWRCVHVSELSDVSVEAGEWHTGPDHSRPQTCVDLDQIIAEVEF